MTMVSAELLADRHTRRWQESRWIWHDVVLPLFFTRALLTLMGFVAVNTMISFPKQAALSHSTVTKGWILAWSRWDAIWYLRIVRDGYYYLPGHQSSIAFFPLYPLLMRLGGLVFGEDELGWLFSGMVISNLLLLIGLIYLYKLICLDFSQAIARRAVLYALIAPSTLFLSAVYPMSLMLALVVGAFYCARKGNWAWAAGFSALAVMTRPDGLFLACGILYEYAAQHQFRWQAIKGEAIGLLLLPALVFGAWLGFQQVHFGDALAFLHVQANWIATSLWPEWEDWDGLLVFTVALASGGLLVAGWKYLRGSYMLYASAAWLLAASVGRSLSLPRFIVVLFPLFVMLAILGENQRFDRAWFLISASLAYFAMLRFSLCYFVG